jgi:hypothetical protein
MQHSGKFKLVVMKAESLVMCDPEWVVCADLGSESISDVEKKVLEVFHKAVGDVDSWNAENQRIMDGK